MTIQEYFGEWSKVIDLPEADRIMRRLSASYSTVCPSPDNIFKAFRLCPLDKLRVVVIGMEPYSQKGVATGLAFANSPDTPEDRLSPSLEVLKESVIDYTVPHGRVIFEPDLEKWEAQGVLLLNAALSCEIGKTGSHILLWRPFMKSFLTNLSNYHTGLVYLLMGAHAKALELYINRRTNYVIHIRHPSWYARNGARMPSEVWKEVNSILIRLNGTGIEWYQEH